MPLSLSLFSSGIPITLHVVRSLKLSSLLKKFFFLFILDDFLEWTWNFLGWTWNVRYMNQGKLEVVKQEMARVNVNILGISELKWMGTGKLNSDDHYIYYCGQESLRRNGVALIVNKRVWNAVLGCNLKNDRMISVHFQGKLFNITEIQIYAPTTNAEEAEVEWFYKDLQGFQN